MKRILPRLQAYRSLLSYLFFGGCTTLINILVFAGLSAVNTWNYQLNNVIAWLLAVIFAYITNKLWVFNSVTTNLTALFRELVSFFGFRLLSLALDVCFMEIGVSLLHANPLLVKISDNVVVIAANYVFSKLYIFKNIA